MKSIMENTVSEIEEKKSRFIGLLCKVSSREEVQMLLEKCKKDYPKATHYCYAYIIEQEEFCSDDKEPTKTAGFPILNVLKQKELCQVCGVVIRYFGGIKLGTGGLVRAYTKAIQGAVQKAQIVSLEKGYIVHLYFPYEDQNKIDYLLKGKELLLKKFDTDITYGLKVTIEEEKMLNESGIKHEIIASCWITKKE